MRILIAHAFYRLAGGEDRYVVQQAQLLGEDHVVELLARDNSELPRGLGTASQLTFSRSTVKAASKAFDAFRPDIAHLHNAYPAWGPAIHLAAKRRLVPLVMTVHNFRLRCPNGYMFTESAPCRRCEKGMYANAIVHRCFPDRGQAMGYAAGLWVHRFLLKLEDKVTLFITPSAFMKERMLEWGIDPERVIVVRNFTREPLGSSDPGEYGMYLGRLSAEKGVDILLHALKATGDVRFLVVGEGPESGALRALADDLRLTNVEFVGRVDPEAVTNLLRHARFVVMPSVWEENAPLAALETMAAGRPLVVTSTGGLPELVANGEGVIVPPGDPQALARAMSALAQDDAACRSIGEQALVRSASEFTPNVHAKRLEEAYSRALALA